VPDLDILAPVYNGGVATKYGLGPGDYSEQTVSSRRYGVFVQDQMHFGSHWVLAAGGRFDRYEDEGSVVGEAGSDDASAITGRLGVVFKPTDLLSLYASASNGFSRPDFVHPPRQTAPSIHRAAVSSRAVSRPICWRSA